MNWLDGIILGILGLSVLIGLMRGLVAEVLSLVTWIAAFWVAAVFGPDVAALFEHSISLPMARIGLGYAICFFGILLLGVIVRFAARRLIWSTGLTGMDRVLGVLFGFVRGVLVVTILVFLVGLTAVTREPWWQQSTLLPQFQVAAAWLGQNIPASVGEHLHPEAVLDKLKSAPVLQPGPARSGTTAGALDGVAPAALLKQVDGLSERLHDSISGRRPAPASTGSTPPPPRHP
ncbi:CvpA family protein [Rhodanobacter lindaniclasticus]